MIRKLGFGVALAAMVTVAGPGEAAESAQSFCQAGVASATPQPWRYDAIYRVSGAIGNDLQPRNGGYFDAIVCNMGKTPGSYFQQFRSGQKGDTDLPAESCLALRDLSHLGIRTPTAADTCVWVRYRDDGPPG